MRGTTVLVLSFSSPILGPVASAVGSFFVYVAGGSTEPAARAFIESQ
jgi:hypothetical protein